MAGSRADSFSRCKNNFLVPATTQGIMWEAREVLKDPVLLSKTIIFAPPEYYWSGFKDEWKEAGEAYAREFGCTLPDYNAKGLMFTLSKELKFNELHFIGAKREKAQIRKTLVELRFLDDSTLRRINKEYPTKCAGWVVAFALYFCLLILFFH
jgi:hypothetical protein